MLSLFTSLHTASYRHSNPCSMQYVFCISLVYWLSYNVSSVAQWQSIRTSNRKVIGSTVVGNTRIFLPSIPVSLTEKHISGIGYFLKKGLKTPGDH